MVIPARGGSKGLPGKNIRQLGGKPLICHAIDLARQFTSPENIYVSTDDPAIAAVVEDYGTKVPFMRPASLSDDKAGMREVLLHALDHAISQGIPCKTILLLQPTSPFRTLRHIREAAELFDTATDMVVSVAESHHNPYFSLFEENTDGFLQKSKPGVFLTRQECPKAYYFNGAVYFINCETLRQMPIAKFGHVRKYVMDDLNSIDIDTPLDWAVCETILEKGYFAYENY